MTSPSPAQIRDALRDHGVPVKLCRGWDTLDSPSGSGKGRSWDEGGGLKATITHHTATASATGSSGAPSLEWLLSAYSKPAANMLIGRGPEDVYLAAAGSCFHPGKGGPAPKYNAALGNTFHYMAFGVELDDPGREIGSLTDWQVECNGRVLAAIAEVAGLELSDHYTHTCWTNLCHGMNLNVRPGEAVHYGRKDDTLGDSGGKTGLYSATFWREQAAKHAKGGGDVPAPADPIKESDMHLFLAGRGKWALLSGDRFARIPEAVALEMKKAGVKWSPISEADMATMNTLFASEKN